MSERTAISLTELDAYFLPTKQKSAPVFAIVRKKRGGRSYSYMLSNGRGCGAGFLTKESAKQAGDKAANLYNSAVTEGGAA